jgi:hypothetical protein
MNDLSRKKDFVIHRGMLSPALRFCRFDGKVFKVHGQNAKALEALVEAELNGVSAREVSSWTLRFAACVWALRWKYGLAIATTRDTHPGGWHGRYVLQLPVTILVEVP